MGMSPVPLIPNLFVEIYEEAHVKTFPRTILHFLKCFIDDGFGIWLRDPVPHINNTQNWETFLTLINSMELTLEFSQCSNEVIFMDLTIMLTNGKISTKLYAKPMVLYLFPPFSYHAPCIAI
jgi:hypothetical protein